MTPAAVCDTGPLIHLAEIDALSLLTDFDELGIPDRVFAELQDGPLPSGLANLAYERQTPDPGRLDEDTLDPGETAALALAIERDDAVLLTDDLAARERATELNVEVHGSIGVLVFAYANDRLSRDEAVQQMRALQRETSLFVSIAVVERGISMLERD